MLSRYFKILYRYLLLNNINERRYIQMLNVRKSDTNCKYCDMSATCQRKEEYDAIYRKISKIINSNQTLNGSMEVSVHVSCDGFYPMARDYKRSRRR